MLPGFCRDAVTVVRAPLKDSRGTKVRDWANAVPHEIEGCSVQPSGTDADYSDARQPLRHRMTLYAPPGADIEAHDRIAFDGQSYEIDGIPMPYRSPTGRVSHVVCDLVAWEG